jgi:hypothetical protein
MSEMMSKNITWNVRLEEYFCETGEKALCLAWIHKQAEALYSKRTTFIDLPVIVLSGVLGFLSVGSSTMFNGNETVASMAVGAGSLFVSVLNTVGSYFGWSKRAEGHRIANIQYAKLHRFLMIEMSLPRDERLTPHDLLKLTRETVDRLQEISPLLPPECIATFKKRFGNAKYDKIAKPEEANGLHGITPFQEEESSAQLVETPYVVSPKMSVILQTRRSSRAQQESHSQGEQEANTPPESHSQPMSSSNGIRIGPPPSLEV